MQGFSAWVKAQEPPYNPHHDLIQEIKKDQEFPRNIRTIETLLDYLYHTRHVTKEDVLRAAADLWSQYAGEHGVPEGDWPAWAYENLSLCIHPFCENEDL